MAAAIERLRALPDWDEWISFIAQGYGGHGETYRHREIRLKQDCIECDHNLPAEAYEFEIQKASPSEVAKFLDDLFRNILGVAPFPDEGLDYAFGAEWLQQQPSTY